MKRLGSFHYLMALCLLLVALPNEVLAASSNNNHNKSTKLRGHRSSKDSARTQTQTRRQLAASLWENTQAQNHIIHEFHTYNTNGAHGPPDEPDEKIVVDVVAEEDEMVMPEASYDDEEEEMIEEASVEEEIHLVTKEEPKGLYVSGGKTSKPKSKVKGGKGKDAEDGSADSMPLEVDDYEVEEEALKSQAIDRQPEATSTKPEESTVEEATTLPPPKGAGRSSTVKESGKGKSVSVSMEPQEIVNPQIVEIRLGFQYSLDTQDKAELEDFGDLATSTSHVCDFIFRHYFMDIEEVEFLSTDRLAIYDIRGPNFVVFTVAAYFDSAASIPTPQELTSIVTSSLLNGSTYYEYYMFLLQELPETNAFHFVSKIDLYSQTSKLTGPMEKGSSSNNNPGRLFKVVVPIVALMIVSVVAALVYINWVENAGLWPAEDEDDGLFHGPPEVRKVLPVQSDCERTVPSHGASSLTDSSDHHSSFSDDSMSESSAHFVDEMIPPTPTKTKTKKVRVSPRVLYRSFNPGEISSRVDFEEVSLYDDEEEKTPTTTRSQAIRKKLEPEGGSDGEPSMLQLMDNFAQVLNMAPVSRSKLFVRRDPEPSTTSAPYRDDIEAPKYTDEDDIEKVSTEVPEDLLLAERTISVDNSVDNAEESITFSEEPAKAFDSATSENPSKAFERATKAFETASKTFETAITESKSALPELSPQSSPQSSPKPSPKVSPKAVLRRMNQALQKVTRLRGTASDGDDTKSFFDDEYEEEVLDEESVYDEEEVSLYDEEEVEDEDDKELDAGDDTVSKASTDTDLVALEEALWGQKAAPDLTDEKNDSTVPLTPVPIRDSTAVVSPKPTPPMPPKQARDFWEKKSAQQETARDFWENKSKPKQNRK